MTSFSESFNDDDVLIARLPNDVVANTGEKASPPEIDSNRRKKEEIMMEAAEYFDDRGILNKAINADLCDGVCRWLCEVFAH